MQHRTGMRRTTIHHESRKSGSVIRSDRALNATSGPGPVPVIDVFAGAGGLSEGFAAWPDRERPDFHVALAVEMDEAAAQTLRLRAFFHSFPPSEVPAEYYRFVRSPASEPALGAVVAGETGTPPDMSRSPRGCGDVWCTELGGQGFNAAELDRRIGRATSGRDDWVLLGGPPCQPFSTAGRSRRGVTVSDPRSYLYREYLSILARHWPAVFVMENVKGILSAKFGGDSVLPKVLEDLSDPVSATGTSQGGRARRHWYRIWPLVETHQRPDLFGIYPPEHYLIECEKYGIPQRRHRVILLGIRDDIPVSPNPLRPAPVTPTVSAVLHGLPPLRSGLARTPESRRQWRKIVEQGPPAGGWLGAATDDVRDSAAQWSALLRSSPGQQWYSELNACGQGDVRAHIDMVLSDLIPPLDDRGGEYLAAGRRPREMADWYHDPRLRGTLNHTSREHMPTDHFRYFYAAAFAAVRGVSPRLRDFPPSLLPEHRNVQQSLRDGNFNDRFRVQLGGEPSVTIMSHLGRDGHYAIHPDPAQARSLSVREAARIQTFPDNYLFCGNRKDQYTQIGNAVPPLLAYQIAEIVAVLLDGRQASPGSGLWSGGTAGIKQEVAG